MPMSSTDTRYQELLDWLKSDLAHAFESIEPASSDASFRRYFRVQSGEDTHIVMDAPPPRENVRPFVKVAGLLREAGVRTPAVHAVDAERGFVLLGDLGHLNYLDALSEETVEALYGDALRALLTLQQGVSQETAELPAYDERLLRTELGIFREWFLEAWLGLDLSACESDLLEAAGEILIESALEQPRVFVHRDYHSRNLMVMDGANPGVLDFQDAVIGPITYDLASLLRDCYIDWPAHRVHAWRESYRDALRDAGLLDDRGVERFNRWFDLMGMQRHLKAAGIFCRLHHRDGKSGYLKDIPRTLYYVLEVAQSEPQLHAFAEWLQLRVLPHFPYQPTSEASTCA